MSALCQKQTFCAAERTSLFDHLVGCGEHGRWDGQADRPRGFQVDYQFVLGRSLYGQVGRFFTPEDAIDIAGRAAIIGNWVRSIGDQGAGGDKVSSCVDSWQVVLDRELDKQVAIWRCDR